MFNSKRRQQKKIEKIKNEISQCIEEKIDTNDVNALCDNMNKLNKLIEAYFKLENAK